MENEKDNQRRDGEQEEPQLKARLRSSTNWTRGPEKMCVVQIATIGPTMTTTTSTGFKAAQPS
jgi:hypothetical protein